VWRDLPFVVALVGVSASIASFVALMEVRSAGQGVIALEHVSLVLIPLSIALALAVERRPTVGVRQAQVATAAVSLAFMIVALVKLYSASGIPIDAVSWADEAGIAGSGALAFGLIGLRARLSAGWLVGAVAMAAGCAGYAVSLQPDTKSFVWYLVAGAAAALAGSAAARMHRL
jgi:hypothetical protein